jgi:hypothetical protein
MTKMSNPYRVNLDLSRVAANMGHEQARSVSLEEAESWLKENGFTRDNGHWVAEAVDIGALQPDEIIDANPLFAEPEIRSDLAPGLPAEDSYTLSPSRRLRLSQIKDYEACVLPAFLCGRPRQVRQAARKVARKAIKNRSWAEAMEGTSFVHIDDAPGFIVMAPPHGWLRDDNLLAYAVNAEVSEIAFDQFDKPEAYAILRDLKIAGCQEFWHSLGTVVGYMGWLPMMDASFTDDLRRTAEACFPSIMRWWPHFCARNERFYSVSGGKWPNWGLPSEFFHLLNWPIPWEYLRSVDPATAGKRFQQLWSSGGRAVGSSPT